MRIRALLISLIIIVASIDIMFAQTNERTQRLQQRRTAQKERSDSIKAARDTMSARYPISQTAPETLNDLTPGTLDLHTPSNIVTDTIYNPEDSSYTIRTTLGKESQLGTPIKLRQKEYAEWHLSQSMMRYFPPKGTAGLAVFSVRTFRRLPWPPARSMAIQRFFWKYMVTAPSVDDD